MGSISFWILFFFRVVGYAQAQAHEFALHMTTDDEYKLSHEALKMITDASYTISDDSVKILTGHVLYYAREGYPEQTAFDYGIWCTWKILF